MRENFGLKRVVINPELLPVKSIASEGAVDVQRLDPTWIRQRFASDRIAWQPELGDEQRYAPHLQFKSAAVLLPIVIRDEGLQLMLTRRAAHLHDHPGQISFPGGRYESNDGSLIDTALREAEEEVGLQRSQINVVGQLPDYRTVSGYQVTPVIGFVQPPFSLKTDLNEVAEVFEVPLAFFMDASNHQQRAFFDERSGVERSFYTMPFGEFFIWGATAGILRNFFHFMRA